MQPILQRSLFKVKWPFVSRSHVDEAHEEPHTESEDVTVTGKEVRPTNYSIRGDGQCANLEGLENPASNEKRSGEFSQMGPSILSEARIADSLRNEDEMKSGVPSIPGLDPVKSVVQVIVTTCSHVSKNR